MSEPLRMSLRTVLRLASVFSAEGCRFPAPGTWMLPASERRDGVEFIMESTVNTRIPTSGIITTIIARMMDTER